VTDTSLIDARAEQLIIDYAAKGVFEIDPDAGEIWRVGKLERGRFTPVERRRAEHPREDGYLRMRVMINGVRIQVSAHRVIWIAKTQQPIPEGHVLDHKNGRKGDNRFDNLEPVLPSENTRRYYRRRWQ
jgi:hypothetical protein